MDYVARSVVAKATPSFRRNEVAPQKNILLDWVLERSLRRWDLVYWESGLGVVVFGAGWDRGRWFKGAGLGFLYTISNAVLGVV